MLFNALRHTLEGVTANPPHKLPFPILRDGLPVSAEPGLTHDILVSRTSVRPKACNQVTGRRFGVASNK
ncbi:hypothetical protein NECAME_02453 [Necator americanus]|uniref:Uncharacterized protein n=1 Tax=Necator americanus TaxID=51031 RepID=W2TFK2_NECAM|nr:hypothetical protein NECAME_02453 [Necator americanus]ETN79976.1 hypothetical protein NECAME_02453 [Necator americanus]